MTVRRKLLRIIYSSVVVFSFACAWAIWAQSPGDREVLAGTRLGRGFDLGANTSGGKTDWVTQDDGAIKMEYPAGQSWGAVFITFGRAKTPPRPTVDVSRFAFLVVEMRGDQKAKVSIGIKDNKQPDDGTEHKVVLPLSNEYRRYIIPLARFRHVDLQSIYVAAEVVFSGSRARNIWIRGISYVAHVDPVDTGILLK